MKRSYWIAVVVVLALIAVAFIVAAGRRQSADSSASSGSSVVQVVAAENFWGSLAAQIGGTHVHVLSIVSDPNSDPHEYESSTDNARAVADANYVIENGAGYDSWMDKLVGASDNTKQKLLNVAALVSKKEGDNPHMWYDPAYVNQVAAQIQQDLASIDPGNAAYYKEQYQALQGSFAEYQGRIAAIKQQFGGTKVAATEDIFAYLADAAGLDLISPPAFIEAVAEGNDPPASSIVQFEQQLKSGEVKVLVYNEQTVTPLTDSVKEIAAEQGIPLVGVTETIQPPDATFQEWMNAQLISLQNALNAKALGQ